MKLVLGFFLILSLAGCSREKTINGEIFVVTKGGQNYKLGLVNVGLVHAEKLTDHLEKRIKLANDTIQAISSTYRQIKDSMVLVSNLGMDLYDQSNLSGYIKNERQQDSLIKRMVPLELIYRTYTSGEFFLSGLPTPDDSSKTDSDGEFSLLVLTNKKYFIVASASRDIGKEKEYYYWAVEYPNPSFREGQKILLSNDNMFEPLTKMNFDKKLFSWRTLLLADYLKKHPN